ncbi:MAG: hypothetical protein J2P37_14230, partial [Ktedonobacteraceae bacterium]|nr:hypothetical protein [Ktedonobacteraceae bacterium]
IQLLALVLRGKADTTEFLRQAGGTHRFVRAYVSEEILKQQPAEIQRFLLFTCVLRRLCGALCDVVLGEAGSEERLTQLRAANLFVSALDEAETWYRYHPFFAEALLAHLREREPERIPELYRRASRWYEEQHQEEEACEYALLAGDQSRAAALMEQLMPQLFERGEFLHMRTLLAQLPPDVIAASPLLSLALIWAQRFDKLPLGSAEQVVEILPSHLNEQIQTQSRDHAAFWAEFPEMFHLRQTWMAMAQGDTERSITLAHQARSMGSPTEDALSRFITASRQMTLGVLYRARGDLEAAEQELLETFPAGSISADHPQFLSTVPMLAEIYEARGQLRALGQLYEQVFQQLDQGEGSSSFYLALMQVRQANLFYEWNQLAEAEERAQQARALVSQLELPFSLIPSRSSWVQAQVALAWGNDEQAGQLFARAASELAALPAHAPQLFHPGQRSMEAFSVRLALMQGQFEHIERWEARRRLRFDDHLRSSLSRHDYVDYMTLARILMARGRLHRKPEAFKEALMLLDQLRAIATQRNLSGWLREIQVLTTLTLQALGQTKQALSTLGAVLAQAEPEGYVRLFADEGEDMASLLALVAGATAASPAYVQRIQDAILPIRGIAADPKRPAARQPLLEPLSPRELEVLQLMAPGSSNQQIAQQLVISLHTVKLHVKHILAKLMVSNRTQAVTRARELHLL